MTNPELLIHLPEAIKQLPCVPFRLVPRASGRLGKVPINPVSGQAVAHTDVRQQMAFDRARECVLQKRADGLGVVLDARHVAVDLDHCLTEGRLTDQAAAIVSKINSYTEVSVSGRGLKILVQATRPGPRSHGDGVELYGEDSYIALTGHQLTDVPLQANQPAVEALYAETFGRPVEPKPQRQSPSTSLDPVLIVERARQARNADKFSRLYDGGDPTGYGSVSEAEFALLRLIHFWTGPDTTLLEAIFRQSALYDDVRWLRRAGGGHTYGSLTLEKVIKCGGPVYGGHL